jgi:hypothetical protein
MIVDNEDNGNKFLQWFSLTMNASTHPRIGSIAMLAIAALFIALKETPDSQKLNNIFVQVVQAGL